MRGRRQPILFSFAAFFSRLLPLRSKPRRAAASHQFEYGEFGAASGSAGNRSRDRGQNSKDAQAIRTVPERGRFARDQRLRPKTLQKMRKYLTVGKPRAKSDSKSTEKNQVQAPSHRRNSNLNWPAAFRLMSFGHLHGCPQDDKCVGVLIEFDAWVWAG